jgi:hypothetical protein
MRKGLNMTAADAEAHQRKHGFPAISEKGREILDVLKAKALPREMNKTEAEFGRILEARIAKGELRGPLMFEKIKLRLGKKCWYTPDWSCFTLFEGVWLPIFFEVKGGHIWDDSKVKFKTAVEQHPWAFFDMWQKKAGQWKRIG